MSLQPGRIALVTDEDARPARPDASAEAFGGISIDRLVAPDEASILLLAPPGLGTGHNLAALVGWHRARGGGVTLVTGSERWVGIAAVDRELLQHASLDPDTWNPGSLIALGGPRARTVAFPGHRPLTAVLLDRDGTIIVDRDYLADPERVTLLPGAAAGLRLLASQQLRLVVLTNQSGVGRGRISLAQLGLVHGRLRAVLTAEGIILAGIYSCPHRSDAGCNCRKPATGLALRAASELDFDIEGAVVAGDKPADIALARRLGVPAFLVTTCYGGSTLTDPTIQADYLVDGLDEMARICLHPAGLAVAAPPPND